MCENVLRPLLHWGEKKKCYLCCCPIGSPVFITVLIRTIAEGSDVSASHSPINSEVKYPTTANVHVRNIGLNVIQGEPRLGWRKRNVYKQQIWHKSHPVVPEKAVGIVNVLEVFIVVKLNSRLDWVDWVVSVRVVGNNFNKNVCLSPQSFRNSELKMYILNCSHYR